MCYLVRRGRDRTAITHRKAGVLAIALPTHMSYSQHMKQPRKTQYYKLQYYDEKSLTWMDVQKQFDSLEEGLNETDIDRTFRFMWANGKTRMPVYMHRDALNELRAVRLGTSLHQPREWPNTVPPVPAAHFEIRRLGNKYTVIDNR